MATKYTYYDSKGKKKTVYMDSQSEADSYAKSRGYSSSKAEKTVSVKSDTSTKKKNTSSKKSGSSYYRTTGDNGVDYVVDSSGKPISDQGIISDLTSQYGSFSKIPTYSGTKTKTETTATTKQNTNIATNQSSTTSNTGTTYKIVSGDTLSAIARKFGTTVTALAQANGISNPNLIYAGKTLKIPGVSSNTNTNTSTGTQKTVAEINAAREANINAGKDPYSGAGAKGQLASGNVTIENADSIINGTQDEIAQALAPRTNRQPAIRQNS